MKLCCDTEKPLEFHPLPLDSRTVVISDRDGAWKTHGGRLEQGRPRMNRPKKKPEMKKKCAQTLSAFQENACSEKACAVSYN